MNEEIIGDQVVRTIKYRGRDDGLTQATVKVAAYFLMYPPSLYGTRVSYSRFEDGIYHIRIQRKLFASDHDRIEKSDDLDLSRYVGKAEYVELVDFIQALKTKIITIRGWKSKDDIKVERLGTDVWRVIEHRKQKGTGEIEEIAHTIDHDDVQDMWKVVCEKCAPNERASYRQLIRGVIEGQQAAKPGYDLDVDMESFNSGRNRSRYYFPLYYYPLKILEYLKCVIYHGRGGVTRIEEKHNMELI